MSTDEGVDPRQSAGMDPRQSAAARIADLTNLLKAQGELQPIVDECDALARAVAAFHMEGIRFRIFNVDRLLSRAGDAAPAGATLLLAEVRRHLEAAGFHTRSHQAPG